VCVCACVLWQRRCCQGSVISAWHEGIFPPRCFVKSRVPKKKDRCLFGKQCWLLLANERRGSVYACYGHALLLPLFPSRFLTPTEHRCHPGCVRACVGFPVSLPLFYFNVFNAAVWSSPFLLSLQKAAAAPPFAETTIFFVIAAVVSAPRSSISAIFSHPRVHCHIVFLCLRAYGRDL
jgi:hypothetical protein